MQSADGGWAAFDVDNNWAVLNQVPFADHNAMLDPTCPDITGRVVECSAGARHERHEAVRRGVAYLLQRRRRTEAGTGAGASTTSMGPVSLSEASRPPAAATGKPRSCGRSPQNSS